MPLGDTPFEMNHWQKWFAAGLFGFLSCASSLAEQPGTPFVIMSWELPPRAQGFDDPRNGLASLGDCGFLRRRLSRSRNDFVRANANAPRRAYERFEVNGSEVSSSPAADGLLVRP